MSSRCGVPTPRFVSYRIFDTLLADAMPKSMVRLSPFSPRKLTPIIQFTLTLSNTSSPRCTTSWIGSYLCSWTIWISILARTSGTYCYWRGIHFYSGPRWRCWQFWSQGCSFRNGRSCLNSYGELCAPRNSSRSLKFHAYIRT